MHSVKHQFEGKVSIKRALICANLPICSKLAYRFD